MPLLINDKKRGKREPHKGRFLVSIQPSAVSRQPFANGLFYSKAPIALLEVLRQQ
ncbi:MULTISPECIES: hypothetical protein [Moorena]|uniref:Uncharacterized protein n=1 Tax=Moorena producens 3L TaxID=489825 RepID=F4Y212_9CYAN|nr:MULTISPECIES: hypothetical protein [Moorena]EGJ29304.1 hypothetical protein LYNGBM3L_67240 [Moorena producens 3L]NEP33804.1 hypothetical protein [Moorena sp. SIO3B2]NEP67371.1 hypothetical protein [Moorena sp. SIO3A5]